MLFPYWEHLTRSWLHLLPPHLRKSYSWDVSRLQSSVCRNHLKHWSFSLSCWCTTLQAFQIIFCCDLLGLFFRTPLESSSLRPVSHRRDHPSSSGPCYWFIHVWEAFRSTPHLWELQHSRPHSESMRGFNSLALVHRPKAVWMGCSSFPE